MDTKSVIRSLAASVVVFTAGTTAALATPEPNVFDGGNRWLVTAYDDSSAVHQQLATQGICFYPYAATGTHIRGRWVSDTFPDWNGIYSQEGDQVFMHGDYAHDVGHDGMSWEIVTMSRQNGGAGHWFEWRENGAFGNTIVFANATFTRVGRCNATHIESIGVTPRYLTDGRIAENPWDPDQVPLDDLQKTDTELDLSIAK